MQEYIHIVPAPQNHMHVRLVVESFDSSDECSLEHWASVCRLVEDGDSQLPPDEMLPEIEPTAWN